MVIWCIAVKMGTFSINQRCLHATESTLEEIKDPM
jgi:hypothetical protein